MTRQERLEALIDKLDEWAWLTTDWDTHRQRMHDTLAEATAALEQQAIDAYLAEVPLPEGWTEEAERAFVVGDAPAGYIYWETVEGFGTPPERVHVNGDRVKVWSQPAHWPAIPLPVLIRAAVQCHRLREAGR